jgi:hypothetical protein
MTDDIRTHAGRRYGLWIVIAMVMLALPLAIPWILGCDPPRTLAYVGLWRLDNHDTWQNKHKCLSDGDCTEKCWWGPVTCYHNPHPDPSSSEFSEFCSCPPAPEPQTRDCPESATWWTCRERLRRPGGAGECDLPKVAVCILRGAGAIHKDAGPEELERSAEMYAEMSTSARHGHPARGYDLISIECHKGVDSDVAPTYYPKGGGASCSE